MEKVDNNHTKNKVLKSEGDILDVLILLCLWWLFS